MKSIFEILARFVGPVMLATALSVFYYLDDQNTLTLNLLKSQYTSDATYSQQYTEYTTEGIESVTDKQLRSLLVNGLDYVVIIQNVQIQRKFEIIFSEDNVNVTSYAFTTSNPDGNRLGTSEGLEAALACVRSGSYSVVQEYDLAQNVRRVVFRKV